MIISLMGEYQSGKDYFTEHLVQKYKAVRLSFSDQVRHLAVKIFPWLPFDFDPAVKDKPFIHPNNPMGLTPRQIWLLVGKVREVTPKYFVDAFLYDHDINTMQESDTLYIITDFRTPDEWDLLQDEGIPVLKIERESREGLIPSAFEEFVRRFNEYDALFVNKMNGTQDFDAFFEQFLKRFE